MGSLSIIVWTITIFGIGCTWVNCEQEELVVTKLRDYLRIPTVHPDPQQGYLEAIEWLKTESDQLGLDFHLLDLGENADFALWMTWNGSNPTLKSVLFDSHMDVVAADPAKWDHPPFEAYKDSDGNIFARGVADMKIATVGTLEAIRRLKESGFQPLRTIHISVMPDEEKGGRRGIRPFLLTPEFKNLNVGIDIDEGGVNAGDTIDVRYAEKSAWQFNITARGTAGHGSTLPEFTAGQRLQVAIDRLLKFREEQFIKLQSPGVTIDQITVLNLVQLGGGLAENIIPNEVWAAFDMRVRINSEWNFTDVERMLLDIVDEARLGSRDDPDNQVSISYIGKNMEFGETITNDSNIWWTVVQNSCRELNVTCEAAVSNGATDGRFLRNIGIPVFGLGPFLRTTPTAHMDNEYINEAEFLRGIGRYRVLIRNLATTPESDVDRS